MNYYDEKDRQPQRIGALATLCFVVVVVLMLSFIDISIQNSKPDAEVIIEFVEEMEQPEERVLPPQRVESPRHQTHSATEEKSSQVSGTQQTTTRVNNRPGFAMNNGPDDAEESMDPLAPDAPEESRSGHGVGLNVVGNDALEMGLQGRGLVGSLPKPSHPGNKKGKVVIYVTVDKSGKVINARQQTQGSTINDYAYVEAAMKAAMQARFHESDAIEQGGTITYTFNLN